MPLAGGFILTGVDAEPGSSPTHLPVACGRSRGVSTASWNFPGRSPLPPCGHPPQTPSLPPLFSLLTPSSSHHRAGDRGHRDPGEPAWGAGDHGVPRPGLPTHPCELAQGWPAPPTLPAHPPAQLWPHPQVGERLPGPGASGLQTSDTLFRQLGFKSTAEWFLE